ncbi:MAG TPA: TRAP transporter small permease [Syntrophorhabdaceae bacterium]|nr:TRAP transporter small permease [Syntrophorhabdaceae bacterium]
MGGYYKFISWLSNFIFWISGCILVFMMMITVSDVILRYFSKSIAGTYELVSFAGALLVGFAIARTTLDEGHVFVDLLIDKIGERGKNFFRFITKIAGGILFVLMAWSFYDKGNELFASNEVSMTLHIPFYPVAYGLSLCAIIEAFVLFSESFKNFVVKK